MGLGTLEPLGARARLRRSLFFGEKALELGPRLAGYRTPGGETWCLRLLLGILAQITHCIPGLGKLLPRPELNLNEFTIYSGHCFVWCLGPHWYLGHTTRCR